ncbi:hypothetical protein Tco_1389475, partial [Tanacetum coccineum]
KKYPLIPSTLSMMLEKKLQIDYESEMAYQLLKFIVKQLKNIQLVLLVNISTAGTKVNAASEENGATLPKTTTMEGVMTEMPITTAEEKAQRKLEVKARSNLMMGIPNEHQLKFSSDTTC